MADLFAIPYEHTVEKEATIVQQIGAHPWWFTGPQSPEQHLVAAAVLLHDPFNRQWEVWRGGQLVGIMMLSRIHWGADALVHFVFFDQDLAGKRQLLLQFLEYCLTDLGFTRLSFEVPEYATAILNFARRKLGFRFEGEDRVQQCLTDSGQAIRVKSMFRRNHREPVAVILAANASRRERSHWHKGSWHDVLCLRTTREEFLPFVERACPSLSLAAPSLPVSPPRSPVG